MKFSIVLLPEAKQDLRLSAIWYNKQKKGLGNIFLQAVRESRRSLQANPQFYKRYKGIRTLPLRKFPFMLHFTIDGVAKTEIVLAALHTSQSPDKWPGNK